MMNNVDFIEFANAHGALKTGTNSPTKHQVARRLAEREIENVVNISIEQ
jgi:hypothetical protein